VESGAVEHISSVKVDVWRGIEASKRVEGSFGDREACNW